MLKLLCLLGLVVSGALAGALRTRRDHHSGCNCPNPSRSGYYGGGYHGRSAFSDPSIADGRLMNQEARLDDLENYFQGLVDKYDAIASDKDARVQRYKTLREKIWALESHCGKDHYSCAENECIGRMLMCDGTPDCRNGRDETPETCRIITEVGTAWEGRITVQDSCTSRKPHFWRFVSTGVEVDPYFPAIPKIRASIVVRYMKDGEEVEESMNSHGIFDFTDNRVVLYSEDGDNLVFSCYYDQWNDDDCRGELSHGNGDVCATFGMKLVK